VIDLRYAIADDVPAVVELVEDLDRFYGTTDFPGRPEREQHVRRLLSGPLPAARVVLALDNAHAIALATYSLLWPAAGVTASLYLKELYVRPTHRRHGIGTQLLAYLAGIAVDAGYTRIEWTTDRANTDAQAFYAQLGAKINGGKIMYRFDGSALSQLSAH
jgi:GNAT superfamily N-acetyltransferase